MKSKPKKAKAIKGRIRNSVPFKCINGDIVLTIEEHDGVLEACWNKLNNAK